MRERIGRPSLWYAFGGIIALAVFYLALAVACRL